MDFLFHFQLLIGVIAQSSAQPKLINYCLGGRTTKKLILDIFSIRPAKSVQVISPYTSNASDSHTVLHTLWIWYQNEKVQLAQLASVCAKYRLYK
jgi:hypothetical protein